MSRGFSTYVSRAKQRINMIRLWLGIALTFSLQPNIMYTSILTYQRFLWALKAELLAIGATIVPGHLVPWGDACWPRRKANSFLWIYCSVSSSSPPPKDGLGILSAPLGILGKAPGMELASQWPSKLAKGLILREAAVLLLWGLAPWNLKFSPIDCGLAANKPITKTLAP